MKRTLADARRVFEQTIRPTANAYTEREATRILEAEEERARATATERADRESQAIADQVRETQRELTEVRDAYERVTSEGATAPTASELSTTLTDLRERERQALVTLDRLSEETDRIERMESDPLGFIDETLYERHPDVRPMFPW